MVRLHVFLTIIEQFSFFDDLGKSSFGNTIIGKKVFEAQRSFDSITKQCAVKKREYKGKQIIVANTPGFFDTTSSSEEAETEIAKSYQIMAPGPHAFRIIHNINNRLTEEHLTAAKRVRSILGEEAANYCIIVFTGLDQLEEDGSTIEERLKEAKSNPRLKNLLNDFGERYIAVNNQGTDAHKKKVLDELLCIIQKMISQTPNRFYTTAKFEEVANVVSKVKAQGQVVVNPDGSIILLPEVRAIIQDYLH